MDFSQKGVYCFIFENQDCKFEVGEKGEFLVSFRLFIYTLVQPLIRSVLKE